jgi:succinate dehydrogenase/fumarate reductase cytochrome b subunit
MKSNTPSVLIRIFHRWSGLLLIIFVSLKLLSGFIIAGDLDILNLSTGYRIHYAKFVDIPLIFFFIFHALYGILKIIMSRGIRNKMMAFTVTTIFGIVIFIISVIYIYII